MRGSTCSASSAFSFTTSPRTCSPRSSPNGNSRHSPSRFAPRRLQSDGEAPALTMRAPVLHVAPFLWSGAGGVITRLCEAQRRTAPVVVVTTGRSGDLDDWRPYRQRLRRAGVTHHSMDFFHRDEQSFWSSASQLADLV